MLLFFLSCWCFLFAWKCFIGCIFSEVLMVVVAVERYLYIYISHKMYILDTCYGMINHRFKQMVVPFGWWFLTLKMAIEKLVLGLGSRDAIDSAVKRGMFQPCFHWIHFLAKKGKLFGKLPFTRNLPSLKLTVLTWKWPPGSLEIPIGNHHF